MLREWKRLVLTILASCAVQPALRCPPSAFELEAGSAMEQCPVLSVGGVARTSWALCQAATACCPR